MALLQRRGRVTYRTLQRQFQLDEDALNDLKDELPLPTAGYDEAGRGPSGPTTRHRSPAASGPAEHLRGRCSLTPTLSC
jgi:hypothetical protein